MEAILRSAKPEDAAKILNGIKTIEVLKTAPKDWMDYLSGKTKAKPEPRTVYIYCSKSGALYIMRDMPKEAELYGTDLSKKCFKAVYGELKHEKPYKYDMSGHVIAKYTLREVEMEDCGFFTGIVHEDQDGTIENEYSDRLDEWARLSCVDEEKLIEIAERRTLYAWHISDLVIFDKPKKLWEFDKVGSYNNPAIKCKKKEQGRCNYGISEFTGKWVGCEKARLTKAPKLWRYVEGL